LGFIVIVLQVDEAWELRCEGRRAFEFCDPLQGGPKHFQAAKEKPNMS
jgi:hypothetical protein